MFHGIFSLLRTASSWPFHYNPASPEVFTPQYSEEASGVTKNSILHPTRVLDLRSTLSEEEWRRLLVHQLLGQTPYKVLVSVWMSGGGEPQQLLVSLHRGAGLSAQGHVALQTALREAKSWEWPIFYFYKVIITEPLAEAHCQSQEVFWIQ